jgi:hypothetical protein
MKRRKLRSNIKICENFDYISHLFNKNILIFLKYLSLFELDVI